MNPNSAITCYIEFLSMKHSGFFSCTVKVLLEANLVKPFTHAPNLQTKFAKLQAHYTLYTQFGIVNQNFCKILYSILRIFAVA